VRAALQAVADISGLNIITSDSVTGSLTLQLKQVPWDQALDVILQAQGPGHAQERQRAVDRAEGRTADQGKAGARAEGPDLRPRTAASEIFQLNYQKAEAFRTVFGLDQNGAATADSRNRVLSKRGSAIIDPRTNQLFVTDIASKIEDIRKLIQKVDIAPSRCWSKRAWSKPTTASRATWAPSSAFADLRGVRGGDAGYSLNGNQSVAIGGNLTGVGQVTGQTPDNHVFDNSQLVNLPAAAINGVTAPTIAFSLFSAAANRFLNLELSALEADGKGKIISSPRVVTEDNVVAVIEQGVELPYQQATSSGATSIAFKKANLRLEVTPQVTPDGNVVLDVDVAKDSKGESTTAGFAINTQHVKTKVMVENGGTVVLGGIYQQSETNNVNKVPLMGDMPVLGNLFKTTARSTSKTELLVFITPKIVAEREQAAP
jgi:type IV pilus assembly protein PilQ